MKKKLVTFGISYCIVFLNVFMTIIFGPAEIFMGNYKDSYTADIILSEVVT